MMLGVGNVGRVGRPGSATPKLASVPVPLVVPAFNGATSGGFTVDASSEFYSGAYPGWRAFDRILATNNVWLTATEATDKWLRLQLPQAARLTGYSVTVPGNGYGQYFPIVWRIEGSSNGLDWTPVDVRSGEAAWPDGTTRSYVVTSLLAFTQYRFYAPLTASGQINDGRLVGLGELAYSFVV